MFEEFPSFDANVHVGGPVEKNTLHYIHSLGNKIEDSIQISENLYWSGNFETLKELVSIPNQPKKPAPKNIIIKIKSRRPIVFIKNMAENR